MRKSLTTGLVGLGLVAFLAACDMTAPEQAQPQAQVVEQATPAEDDPNWNCQTHGDRQCGANYSPNFVGVPPQGSCPVEDEVQLAGGTCQHIDEHLDR